MNKKTIITILLALVAMVGQAQEERTDTIIPKFLSNGYFFREMPDLPDGEKSILKLKDKEGETVKKITDKHHFTWKHLIEAEDMMSWIGTEGFPLTIVVDKQGIVCHTVHGTNEYKRAELLAKIKEVEAK